METLIENETRVAVETAFNRAVRAYIDLRRTKIPEFVHTHFSFSGAVKINRKAFGKDHTIIFRSGKNKQEGVW